MSKTASQHTSLQIRLFGRPLSLNWTTIALAVLVTLAAALRLYQLDASGLWVDEIFTALFASPDKNLAEVAQGPLSSPVPTPPLWFFITHLFLKLLGVSDSIVRLPSVVAGVLGIIAMYKVGEALFDRNVGLASAFLLTVSPLHMHFSHEARFYAAIVFFSLLTVYFLHRGTNSSEKRWWIGFTLATLLNVYIHLTAFFVLAAETLYAGLLLVYELFIVKKGGLRRLFRATWALPCSISLGVIAVCYLPMVPHLLAGIQNPIRGLGDTRDVVGLKLSVEYFLDLLAGFGAGPGLPLSLYLGACLWGVGNAACKHKRQMLLFFLLAVVPFVIVLLLRSKHRFQHKYVIFILPVYLLAMSLGLTHLARTVAQALTQWRVLRRLTFLQPLCLAALVAIYGLVSISAPGDTYLHRYDRWRTIGQLLNANVGPNDAVAILPTPLISMSTEEVMSYYSSSLVEANTVTVEDVWQIQDMMVDHRRVWVVENWNVNRGWAGDVVTWLRSQPRVELAVGKDKSKIVYIGQGQSGLDLLEETWNMDIPAAVTYESIAETYCGMEMWAKCIVAYQRAAALEPDQGIWPHRLAILYDDYLDQPEAALAEYQRAVGLQPEVADFHAALGDLYRRTNRPHEAIAQYQEAIRLYLRQNERGQDSIYVQTWRNAIRDLETVIESNGGE